MTEESSSKKFYTAKYDRVFKTIICDESNSKILKAILEQILRIKIEDVQILRSELPIKNVSEREKTVDLLVKSNDNIYTHVELNTNFNKNVMLRNFIYFMDIICSKTKRGESYNLKDNYIHVDLNYIEGKNQNKSATGNEICEYWMQTKDGKKYTDKIKMFVYNIDKENEFWYDEDGKVKEEYKYLLMLNMQLEELKEIGKGDELIMEYEDKLFDLNNNGEFRAFMTVEENREKMLNTKYEEGLEEGISQGREQGFEQGAQEKAKEMIINLANMNMSIDKIAEVANLPIDEVKRILKESNK